MWVYWPSFTSATLEGVHQNRAIINTVLAISSSCLGAVSFARYFFGKLDMEIMLHATLAGGVTIGASADLINEPWAAMLIGFIAGIVSAFAYQRIGPFLSKNINLQDTCGVHSLFGIPGILGGITSAIVIAGIDNKGFKKDYFTGSATPSEQASKQIVSIIVTFFISIFAGISGGFISCLSVWQPVNSLYRDDDHILHASAKYPSEYLVGGDEVYEEVK